MSASAFVSLQWFAGRKAFQALVIQDKLTPLHAATFLEAGVTGAKTGLSLLGRAREEVRLPLVPSTDKTREAIRAALVHAGVLAG